MKPEISRATMSAQERELRSRAAQLLDGAGLIHGTLVERFHVCGKPGCRCARGEKHAALVLSVRRDKKVHQIYIPRSLEERVRRWLDQGHKLNGLVREISRLHEEKIRREKIEKRGKGEG